MAGLSAYLSCPVCGETLSFNEKSKALKCANNHSFDRAKQGYFNLLQNQDKKSDKPGDTAEMVLARRAFLELGHYTPLVEKLNALTQQYLTELYTALNYCDIACGEGYYSEKIFEVLNAENDCHLTGIDISTPAIKSASRRVKDQTWLVGNAFRIPLQSSSQQLVTHLFSRPCLQEASRILHQDGIIIDVETGSEHLVQLRKALYGELKDKKSFSKETDMEVQLHLLHQENFSFEFTLTNEIDIRNLILMTPHAWKANQAQHATAASSAPLTLTADFKIRIYQKDGS